MDMDQRTIGVCYGAVDEKRAAIIGAKAQELGFRAKFLQPGESFVSPVPEGWANDCEIIFGNLPERFLGDAVNLKWLHTSSAGVQNYCVEGVLSKEVTLTNSSGGYGLGIAEHMLNAAFMLLRRSSEYFDLQRSHTWQSAGKVWAFQGLKITVLGLGDIGTAFARKANALGAKVKGVKRSPGEKPDFIEALYTTEQLDEALEGTQLLAICLPGVDGTAGIVSKERIDRLGPDCFLINIGRGSVLDQAALVAALNEGRLAGAALDVFEQEPIPEGDGIWDAKNCIVTPHVAGGTTFEMTIDAIVDLFLANLEDYAQGRPFKRTVNRALGY